MMTINEKLTIENYPYGYTMKTTMYKWIEFDTKKGFRVCSQTVNPKNGRLNNPKKSTYRRFAWLTQENGRVDDGGMDLYHLTDIDKVARFMHDHFDLFTTEQIEYAYRQFIVYAKVTIHTMVVYCNSDTKTLFSLFEPLIKTAAEGMKTGGNLFDRLTVDVNAVEATKEEGYQPFKVTTYGIK